jgi:hypothetical protein
MSDDDLQYVPNLRVFDVGRIYSSYDGLKFDGSGFKYTPFIRHIKHTIQHKGRLYPLSSPLVHLKSLYLYTMYGNILDNESLKFFPNLESLICSSNQITDDGLKHIPKIKTLELRQSTISDVGLSYIPNVRILILGEKHFVTYDAIYKLTKSETVMINGYYVKLNGEFK